MDSHRIEGIKYNFDRLDNDELEGIRGHLLRTHARLVGEIALVEDTLFARRHPELPLEEEVNGAAMDPYEELPESMGDRPGFNWTTFSREIRGL